MGKLIRNGIEYGGGNGTDIFEVTQAEYDALVQEGTLVHNALYVITDAPNLNETAEDISYDGSTTTVKMVVDKAIKTDELIVINSQQTTNADGNIDSNVFVPGGYSDSNYAVLSAVVVDNNNVCVLIGNYNGRFVFTIKSRNDLSKVPNTSVTIRVVLCKTPYLTV